MASYVTSPGEEDKGFGDPLAAVFIRTNLGTHLALDVHPHDTVAELKKNIVLAHSTLFPSYKEIKIDAVKLNRQGLFYSLSDSMLVRTILDGMKGNMFLCVDASVCGEEHLEEQGLVNHAEGLNIEDAVKGDSSLGTKGTDHKETSIEELPLIVPELAVVDNTDQVNGVQQNDRPEQGDNNREFIRDEAIPKAVGAVVCELLVADVVGDKSHTRKRKKPAPKKESSRKQDPEENKQVAKHVEGSEVASSSDEPKIPSETADPEMLPLKGDPKEKYEPKLLVVIGLKADSCLDKSKEAVDGDRTEVHSQGALSKERKGKGPKSTEQVGDASASTKKTKEKTRKSTNASAVPNSDIESETQGTADILGERGDVAGTNKNTEPIPNAVGSSKDMIVSASSKEVEKETVRSSKEIMKSSSRKEGRNEMNKKRRLTSDRHSVAVQNSSKPSAKPAELSVPNAAQNNITSSPLLISSPSENDEEAMKIQTRSSRRAAAIKPREQRVDGQPVQSLPDSRTNV